MLPGSAGEASTLQLDEMGPKLNSVLPRQVMVLIGSPRMNEQLASIGCVALIMNPTLVLRTWPTSLTDCRARKWLLKALLLRSSALLRLVMITAMLLHAPPAEATQTSRGSNSVGDKPGLRLRSWLRVKLNHAN